MRLTVNGEMGDYADGLTVADLLRERGHDPAVVVVERNGQIVPAPEPLPHYQYPTEKILGTAAGRTGAGTGAVRGRRLGVSREGTHAAAGGRFAPSPCGNGRGDARANAGTCGFRRLEQWKTSSSSAAWN